MSPVFLIAGTLATVAALAMVTRRNPVYSAVWLLICFLAFAVLFLEMSATFLAAIHVLVYTGAILVLFVFVIMLLNLRPDELGDEHPLPVRVGAAVLSAGLFALVAIPVASDPALRTSPSVPTTHGTVEEVGMALFTRHALAFELVSLLVLIAMFGALVLAKKRLGFSQ